MELEREGVARDGLTGRRVSGAGSCTKLGSDSEAKNRFTGKRAF